MAVRKKAWPGYVLALVVGCGGCGGRGEGQGGPAQGGVADVDGQGGLADADGQDGLTLDADTVADAPPDASPDGTVGPEVADTTPDGGPETVADAGPGDVGGLLPAGVGASPCQLDGELPQASGIELVPWFTKLDLADSQPIALETFPDGSDRLVVMLRAGQIRLFANQPDVASSKLVLDIAPKVSTAGEGGLLGLAFHPNFKQNRKFYVNYTTSGAKFDTVVVEYTTSAADPEVADPASAKEILHIPQPFANHNGGHLAFDLAGHLLVGMGDGGGGGDPLEAGQDLKQLLGKMLRLDVDHPAGGKPYGIPADNPFVGNPAALPEIYAYGLRNPWRYSVDPVTGALWVGDVGQNAVEEVDVVEAGKNYGWNVMEGSKCYSPPSGCNQAGLELPVSEYDHSQGSSIAGGRVYRGSAQKSLYGAYLYGDTYSGNYWTVRPKAGGGWQTQAVATAAAIKPVSFGVDRQGELYVVQLWGPGQIAKVVEKASVPPAKPLPLLLSQTACFASLQPLQPAAGLVPYTVNAPLWSDGAVKRRWLVMPPGAAPKPGAGPVQVPADDLASWEVPAGTLVIKHFALGETQKPVETRFMKRTAQGWQFFTYRWNAAGTDAELLPGGGGEVAYDLVQGGQPAKQTWHFPTVAQCQKCHTAATPAEQLLGVRTAQLNKVVPWNGVAANQLAVYGQGGLTSQVLVPADHQALPDVGEQAQVPAAAQLPAHARAYLFANCSQCHRPGGGAPTDLDLRYGTPLPQTKTCQVAPQGGPGVALIAPGKPQDSAVTLRMAAAPGSPFFMPPIGVHVPDENGRKLVEAWLAGLAGCE